MNIYAGKYKVVANGSASFMDLNTPLLFNFTKEDIGRALRVEFKTINSDSGEPLTASTSKDSIIIPIPVGSKKSGGATVSAVSFGDIGTGVLKLNFSLDLVRDTHAILKYTFYFVQAGKKDA